MPEQRDTMRIQDIVFANGNAARAICLPSDAHVQVLPPLLQLPSFSSVIMLAGGAEYMKDDRLHANLVSLFTLGLASFATAHSALVIDGGTQSGVMELMGQGAAAHNYAFPLLGVAPSGLVCYPGEADIIENSGFLDPDHSHFVLVQAEQWGEETATMYELAQVFSEGRSSVAILVNGGAIAIQEALYNVRQGRPLLVLEGSGRAADEIAQLWREKSATSADADLAEIVRDGDIHIFPAIGSAPDLIRLLLQLLRIP